MYITSSLYGQYHYKTSQQSVYVIDIITASVGTNLVRKLNICCLRKCNLLNIIRELLVFYLPLFLQ
jgi:hypothetical protein